MSGLDIAGWAAGVVLSVVPGLAWAPRSGSSPRPSATAMALGIALSPALVGAVTALLLAAGLAIRPASGIAFLAVPLAGLVLVRRGATLRARTDATVLGVAVLVAAGVALLPATHEFWRVWSDAWTHAGIVRAIGRDGVPPGDPWYAGHALHYAWIYHVDVAALQAWTGCDVFALMSSLTVLAAFAIVVLAGDAALRLGVRRPAWALALLVLGLNALFPLFMPFEVARAFGGHHGSLGQFLRTMDWTPFGVDRVGAFLRNLGGQDFFLDKFMVSTPFAVALAAYAGWLVTALRALGDEPGETPWTTAALAVAAGLLHPVVGMDLGAMGALALAYAAVGPAPGPARARMARWAAASLAGTLPVAWFIATQLKSTGGAHDALPIGADFYKLLGTFATQLLALLFAVPALVALRRRGPGDEPRRWVAALALATLALGLVLKLPGPNSFFTVDKFSYLTWIPLALLGAGAFEAWLAGLRAPLRWALVLAVFVPVNGLSIVARVADPGTPVRQPWSRPAFAWMRAHVPADAVLVTRGDVDAGVFTGRDLLYGIDADADLRGYPPADMAARRALVREVFDEGRLSPASERLLAGLHRPVVVVWTRPGQPWLATTPGAFARLHDAVAARPPRPAGFDLAWSGPDDVVLRWSGGGQAPMTPANPAPATGVTPP